MKRWGFIIILLLFSMLLVSCASSENCAHEWERANCTAPITCRKCGHTIGEKLGHTTNSGICSRCGANFSTWSIKEYVDEFEISTGERYVSSSVKGKCSNSYIEDLPLTAELYADAHDIGFRLWEYGESPVICLYGEDTYTITALDSAGQKHYFTGYMSAGQPSIFIRYRGDRKNLLNILKESEEVRFHIAYENIIRYTYTFTVHTAGFRELYEIISQ